MTYLAVFDWNGTLFADTPATHKATNACLEFFGCRCITLEEEQATFTFPLIHFYEKMGVDADTYLRHTDEASNIFLETYKRESAVCGLADGAIEMLEWLRTQNVHTMILSNHLAYELEADVARLGITPYMDHVSGNEKKATIASGLSKQRRLSEYMEANGFTPEKTFIIGDSHEEPHVAKALGLIGISITGGLMNAERLAKAAPDHIVDSLTEVRPILEKQWNFS
jgi:phosphoglycolate phosphatase